MPHFKNIIFIKIGLNLSYFGKKNTIFLSAGGSSSRLPKKKQTLQISGSAFESNHVFVLLISVSQELFLMPRLKSINFYQNKLKIKFFFAKK